MESQVMFGTSGSLVRSDPPHRKTARSKRLLEGVLKKYTNVFQGWQTRFFVLDPEIGQLQYYLNEVSRSQRPPRGSLPLLGAIVVSSNEFPYMFTIRSTNGNFYKLRALDSQEQELWMTQLQLCSRCLLDASSKTVTLDEGQQKILANSTESPLPQDGPTCSLDEGLLPLQTTSAATLSCLGECLNMLQHSVVQVFNHNQNQNQNHIPCRLVSYRSSGLSHTTPTERSRFWRQHCSPSVSQVEPEGIGSTSKSLTHTFNDSHSSKHSCCSGGQGNGHEHIQRQNQSEGSTHTDSPTELKKITFKDLEVHPEQRQQQDYTRSPDTPDSKDETTDTEDNDEDNLGDLDDQRSIIFHLLSQLKIGMDLTQVVLPTFILETRSLLEMYASFMAHPDIFISITYGCTPEERIIRFVEYYLTAFHEGHRGTVAKKPYNPILGEYFHCSWLVPRDCVQPLRTTSCSGLNSAPTATSTIFESSQGAPYCCSRGKSDCYLVRFVAEQVSHHPPVSGFYCECKEKRMCVNMHVWTKSKYMGMSVGVSMVGEGVLHLLEHDEEYVFTLPCAYARSILSVPWVELGGKVNIKCAKSGYSATVTFHTKPLYGGKVHRVTAEVKYNQTGTIVCKAQGEWNGMLEFSYNSREKKVIDTSKLPIIKKRIRPLDKQGQYESRYLWQHVTTSLKAGNLDTATEHKHLLEERQRSEDKHRAATKASWKPKYFLKEGEGWVYHNALWKAH